ncbi:MAG TPA: prepilin-type N-terminal cleavage/methylation domain-containing protein [Phycisphaerae bacterium]|nr:prepilin-type N-terminal cleavage/methylation domain-containing protein [Phycisphaerales bacterium]HRX83815.1 prepilin-type N-terminal cleavage/methylation domain-containing protein [Phycisphaerae bacterium]
MRFVGKAKRAFSLVELVIVIVIIGIIAAIAVPRISRGAKGATESAVRGDLAALRAAIDLYAAEHNGVFPGQHKNDGSAGGAASDAVDQLTKYSDINGKTGDYSATDGIVYGPYLRNGMPPLPVGANVGSTDIVFSTASPPTVAEGGGEGWAYNQTTGQIIANTSAKDESDTAYSTY